MKSIRDIKTQPKWYISAAFIFIAVLGGILGKQQVTLPNQEIVLQFSDAHILFNDAEHTISIVEKELQRIGVTNIHVGDQEKGRLVISYYSDTNVENIKKLLSKKEELALGFVASDKKDKPVDFPFKDQSISYNLNVYELQDGQNSLVNLGGKCAVEFKSGNYRFINPNFYFPSEETLLVDSSQTSKVHIRFQRHLVIAKDYRSHKIPEVRAGPLSYEV